MGLDPRKPYSGKIALRVDPDLHARIAATADSRGDSMNNVIVWAITSALVAESEIASSSAPARDVTAGQRRKAI